MESEQINRIPEIIVIGELNVDIIFNRLPGLPEMGKEILAHEMNITLGSSSAIFASNLSVLGSKVIFCGKVGLDAFGSFVLSNLNEKKVDTARIVQSMTSKTGATIVLNYDQDRAMVTHQGAMESFCAEDIDFDFLKNSSHLHVSSIFLQTGIRKDIVSIFSQAKASGLTTSLDPQWDPAEEWELDIENFFPLLDVFMPNHKEFLAITHTQSLMEGIDVIKSFAPNITLIIKDGQNGAYAWKQGELIHQPAFLNKDVVDCIGAGDSFNAGFIHSFVQARSLADSLYLGAVTGAISTTKAGGTGAFASLQQVQKIANERFFISI